MKKFLLSLVAFFSFMAINAADFSLVTSADQLVAGKNYIIVAKDYSYALSVTQKTNNRNHTPIAKGSVITPDETVAILNLKEGTKTDTWSFFDPTNNGYLYAASSGSNYLRTEATLSDNSSASISIATDGVATIKFQGTNTRNWLRYNESSSIFACYGNGQKDVCLYIETESTTAKVATPVITPNEGEITANTKISISCATEGASIYYTIDDSEPSAENGTLYTAPFTLAEDATVKAIAIDPSSQLAPSTIVFATYTFSAANIAEFIEKSPSKATSISGTVTVVGQAGSYLFLQDETAKIVAFGNLDNTYSNGDQLTGVKGTYELYNGLPELKVVASSFGTATEGTPIEPETITLSELKSTELLTYVKVEGVTIPEGSSKSYTIEDASGTATMYNSASITITSGENLTVYGFVSCYNTTIQLLPIEIISASGLEIVETPVISPNGGAIYAETEISIACATEGASIYYTLDGTEPSAENGTLYEAPFTLAEEATVKAIAVAEGMENSSVAEAAFTLLSGTVASVTFDFTDPSSLNPVQETPATGKEISVNDVVFTSGSVSLSFDKGTASNNCRLWGGTSATDLRTYTNSTMTISVTGADITNIVFTGSKIGANYVSANVGTLSDKTWSGSSQSVVFTTSKTTNINTITVTYDTATAIEEVGVDANAPVEYYNLQGVKVARPENGIFIKKQGSKTTKVVL